MISEFKPVTFPEPSVLTIMLVLGREGSSWEEKVVYCDNVKPAN